MRPAQKSNRSRGRGNRKGGGGGNNINRVYDSAGPEGKVRGTPQQIIDKYLTLARDAQTSGDRVAAENFLQHAEHYQRILIQATSQQEATRRDQADPGQEPRADSAGEASSDDGEEKVSSPAVDPEISGMATIDSGPPEGSLLVEAEEPSDQQPRRNGDSRRRRNRAEAPESEPPAEQSEAQAEG